MAGTYSADGSWRISVVDGSVRTGLYAADGSYNVVKAPGGVFVGVFHPCGAWWVTNDPGSGVPLRAPDGSLYVNSLDTLPGKGQRVTVVAGSFGGGSPGAPGTSMGLLLALTYA